tara:strand:- start:1564 stop:2316 length:753 start_codon:yes stop_codon:yes gene_type:complete
MAAISAIAIASTAVSAIGTGVQMYGANKARKRGERLANEQKNKIDGLVAKRATIVNPYENVADLSGLVSNVSGMASNPFANLSVSTAAAEMQVEEADIALANTLDTLRATGASAGGATALARMALESKKGVAASIQQQEANNQQLAARGEERLQNVKMDEATRIQGVELTQAEKVEEAKSRGVDYKFKVSESRNEADINRAAGIQGQALQNAASAQQAGYQALSSGISAVGSNLVNGGISFKAGSGLGSN